MKPFLLYLMIITYSTNEHLSKSDDAMDIPLPFFNQENCDIHGRCYYEPPLINQLEFCYADGKCH